jgi:hypothetical protein
VSEPDPIQATSQVITEPTVLDDEALKPHVPLSLEQRLRSGKSTAEVMKEGATPKRRGRPPGSKNRSTVVKEAIEKGKKVDVTDLTPSERARLKAARAEALATKVTDAVNENLLMILMSMGCPPELLYKPGQEPKQVKENSRYTPLAQQLTIGDFQANMVGHFLAELEATETGGKFGSAVADGKGPLIFYGIISGLCAIQYIQTLSKVYQQFEPLLSAYKAQQLANQQANKPEGAYVS